jgi:hypothetical protein
MDLAIVHCTCRLTSRFNCSLCLGGMAAIWSWNSVTQTSSLTRIAWRKEIFGICVARWYACGLLSITWCSGLWSSLVYFKITHRNMRTQIICFTGMNPIYTIPPFYNVLLVCVDIVLCSYAGTTGSSIRRRIGTTFTSSMWRSLTNVWRRLRKKKQFERSLILMLFSTTTSIGFYQGLMFSSSGCLYERHFGRTLGIRQAWYPWVQ